MLQMFYFIICLLNLFRIFWQVNFLFWCSHLINHFLWPFPVIFSAGAVFWDHIIREALMELFIIWFLTHNSLHCPKCSIQLISFHSLEFTKVFANLGQERHAVGSALYTVQNWTNLSKAVLQFKLVKSRGCQRTWSQQGIPGMELRASHYQSWAADQCVTRLTISLLSEHTHGFDGNRPWIEKTEEN